MHIMIQLPFDAFSFEHIHLNKIHRNTHAMIGYSLMVQVTLYT